MLKCNSDEQDLEKSKMLIKKPDTSELAIKADLNSKNVENEIPSIVGLVTTSAFDDKGKKNENKISDQNKIINTPAFNKLSGINFNESLKQAHLTVKSALNLCYDMLAKVGKK